MMRKNILICIWSLFALSLAGCGTDHGTPHKSDFSGITQAVPADSEEMEPADIPARTPEQTSQEKTEQEDSEGNEVKRIRFLVDGQEIIVSLEDHPAADALYARLPMELTFEDYNGTEKIAYPDEGLPAKGAPAQCDPKVGSFCYYIPWGNFCFFYQDFRASESLMPLGEVESGLELLESLDTAGAVTVEAVE